MGHRINAIIGGEQTLIELIEFFGLPLPIKLDFDLILIGLDEQRLDMLATDEAASYEGFTYLTAKIAKIIEAKLNHGHALYIETDYFGGIGNQSAALFADGHLIWKDTTNSLECPINEGLAKLGVSPSNGQDEFGRIGLDRFRNFETLGFHYE